MAYQAVERGCLNTSNYRVFILDSEGKPVSPFHDIPLYHNEAAKVCNMVVEIPRWTNHKMEINKEEEMNPIKQDIKNGKVRFVKNCYPYHGYIWNYGALPQTWEDVDHIEPSTRTRGDNDPIDACEIGQKVQSRGSVIQVKILGMMCLVDEGETDWKTLCIDVTDPLADQLNDVDDINKHMSGLLEATREWFMIYKIPDGKPANKFAYNGEAKDREFALKIIEESNQHWQKLVGDGKASRGAISCKNTTILNSPYKVEVSAVEDVIEQAAPYEPADPLPDDVNKWYYIPESARLCEQ